MSKLVLDCEWYSAGQDPACIRETAAQFTMRIGDISLTRNQDAWSKTVRENIFVSVYPLAMWMASSWWRLNYELLPNPRKTPPVNWRMAHEVGAANCGYVWPQVVFASDGEVMQVWANPSNPDSKQSVQYLNGLHTPYSIDMVSFRSTVNSFVDEVVSRLSAVNQADTDLAHLWALIHEDRNDPAQEKIRRIEAQLGFDPEECPEGILATAMELETRIGLIAMSELSPVYGRRDTAATALEKLSDMSCAAGLEGMPQIKRKKKLESVNLAKEQPWQRAVKLARNLRSEIGNKNKPIQDAELYGLLGLRAEAVSEWEPPEQRYLASLAVPESHGLFKFISRKRHPIAKRFEFARFLGDYLLSTDGSDNWLASTDIATSRQKFQRAFSAEFLCPIDQLVEYLDGDFSETAFEEAASNFQVSEQTVESLLANNGYIEPPIYEGWLPYKKLA